MKKEELSEKMLHLIKTLNRIGGVASVHKISKETKISYITVQKYLKELEALKIVTKEIYSDRETSGKRSRTILYKLNYDYLNS